MATSKQIGPKEGGATKDAESFGNSAQQKTPRDGTVDMTTHKGAKSKPSPDMSHVLHKTGGPHAPQSQYGK